MTDRQKEEIREDHLHDGVEEAKLEKGNFNQVAEVEDIYA